jgi:hypothetical protein
VIYKVGEVLPLGGGAISWLGGCRIFWESYVVKVNLLQFSECQRAVISCSCKITIKLINKNLKGIDFENEKLKKLFFIHMQN